AGGKGSSGRSRDYCPLVISMMARASTPSRAWSTSLIVDASFCQRTDCFSPYDCARALPKKSNQQIRYFKDPPGGEILQLSLAVATLDRNESGYGSIFASRRRTTAVSEATGE